jgi:LysM repeat protein
MLSYFQEKAGMRILKRLLYYALINIAISALTVWVVLNIWERRNPCLPVESTPELIVVTATPGPQTPAPLNPCLEATSADASPTLNPETPLPTPTIELVEYIVQIGDTLGTIAERFEVSVADIIYVNQLENPDVLSVGQVLYIPVGGLVIPTETSIPPTVVASPTVRPSTTTTPGPSPTASPTLTGDEPQVYIDNVLGVGDLNTERVILRRSGLGELSLAAWQLRDQDGTVYIFPQLTLYQDGAVNVNTRSGTNTYVDLFWNLSAAVWRSGELVSLYDSGGILRASFTIP